MSTRPCTCRQQAWRAVALVLIQCGFALAALAAPSRPNFVLLLADDWGFTDVGAFGGEIATPHLDELARRGVRFSNFHASASCSPSRAMLLTGVDNHRNGVGNMRETIPRAHLGQPGYLTVLNDRVVTIATLLRDSGYRTYVTGKWHLGKEAHNLPNQRGFVRSLVQGDSGSDNWETAKRYLDLTDKVYWYEDGRETPMPADYYSSEFFVSKMIEYLDQDDGHKEQPFLAYIAFQANHIPLQAPRAFIDHYKGRYSAGWSALRQQRRERAAALGLIPQDTPMVNMASTADWERLSAQEKAYESRRMEVYAGMAQAMDHEVGRLIAHLKASGRYDNTVFIFLSDNGAEASDPYAVLSGRLWLDWQYRRDISSLGAKGAYTVIGPNWASAVASPLATYKFYSGEGGIRVPLIIAGVPGARAGQIHQSFTHIQDIAPTMLELAGLPPQQGRYQERKVEPITGRTLLPVLRGQAERVYPPDQAVGYELSGNQALFKGDLKLLRNIPPLGDGQWRLFDIVRDPGETHDLARERAAEFEAMRQDYEAYARHNGVLPMPEGYDPIRQVEINALFNVYVPRFRLPVLLLLGLLLGWGLWRMKRRTPTPPGR
ncbi:MAG: arylsulfatase [Betaproteobacteria bacterium]|nr:arylsulfatase [Betaproteobacteria bacterium]